MNSTESAASISSGVTLDQSEYSIDDVNTSHSSAGSFDHGVSNVTTKKQQVAAKKLSRKQHKLEVKKEKKRKKNKISKEDFYNKSFEFRIWLSEKKKLTYEDLPISKSKHMFKKFIKKWNNKKLPVQYYRGVDALWAIGSPGTQSVWAMPGAVNVTPGSLNEEALEQRYSRQEKDAGFATFGKKDGTRALKELQRMMQVEKESENDPIGTQVQKKDQHQPTPSQLGTQTEKTKAPPSLAALFEPPSSQQPATPKMGMRGKVAGKALTHKRMPSTLDPKTLAAMSATGSKIHRLKRQATEESPPKKQKMEKQDSYTRQIESAGQAVYDIIETARKQHLGAVTSPVKSRDHGPITPLTPRKPLPPASGSTNETAPLGEQLSLTPGKSAKPSDL